MTLLAVAGAAVRWLLFAAVLVATGAAAFRVLVLRRAGAGEAESALARSAASLGQRAAIVAILAVLGKLPVQLLELRDPEMPLGPQAESLIRYTTWGLAWIWQLALAAFSALAFAMARGGRGAWWAIASLAAIALSFTPAFSGHAIGSERLPNLAVAADGMHVLGAGLWLGAMVSLFAAMARPDAPLASRLVVAFSPLALTAATFMIATGLISAWLHLGTVSALWQSRYGTVLLVKLGSVGLMAAAGAWNWRRATPALRNSGQIGPIRRSMRVELVIGGLVLLATVLLVVTPPPGAE